MTSLGARVTMIEAVVAKLVDRRGERVSAVLELARKRVQAGEPVPPALHTVGELEAMAAKGGLAGRVGRARLRALRGVPPEALLPGTAGGRDAAAAAPYCDRSTALETALAGPSVSSAAIDRIDRLLAVHARA